MRSLASRGLPRRAGALSACLAVGLALELGPSSAAAQEPVASQPEAESCVGKARLRGLGFARDGVELPPESAVTLDLVA